MKKALQMRMLRVVLAAVTAFAIASPVGAQQQQQNDRQPANPLVRLLQSKGILTAEEVTMVSQAATPGESDVRLARLLLAKGIITQQDYDQTVAGATVMTASAEGNAGARVVPAVLKMPVGAADPSMGPQGAKPAGPTVVPAVAPIRVLQSEPTKREGLVPDLKLGPVRLKPYGFFKATLVRDSSSPQGNDFPLPMLGVLGDTGPDASPEFHIKARGMRVGSNFEWIDPSPHVAVTGRFEFDFEGNFTRVSNRNISTIRSSQAGIRLAWARVDYAATDHTTLFALFGQDWTPFGSSTLPNLLETTGLGVGFGTLYERLPQARLGFNHNFGGSRNFKIQPEIAVVLPAFGNVPPVVDNELAFGERQGVDSGRPEVQGRIVFQWQLDKAQGVAPAQIIFSGMQGARTAIVTAAAVPGPFKAAFPTGAKVGSSRYGFTGEFQLPTRYATLIGKYFNGEDLRFYFAGELFSNFNDTFGLTGTVNALSIDGSSTVVFGNSGGAPVVAPQRPVRAQGGFINLGLPLSRIFNADPAGRNAGWSLYLHYGIDQAKSRDVRRSVTAVTNRQKSDLAAGTLYYKLNNWVTFAFEQSYYRTRAVAGLLSLACSPPGSSVLTPAFPLFRGNCAREAHDIRTEFGTIFTF